MKNRSLFGRYGLILLVSLLHACSPPSTAQPPPTPRILRITRPLALLAWDRKLYACARNFPQLAIFVELDPSAETKSDLALYFGSPADSQSLSYVLSLEEIAIIVNRSVPLDHLSASQLNSIYTGIEKGEGESVISSSVPANAALFAWTYPEGDETRSLFEKAVFIDSAPNIHASIAPDPRSMIEAVSEQAGAVGYLPASALDLASQAQVENIKRLEVDKKLAENLRQPVIASLPTTPDDILKAYLSCLASQDN